MVGVSLNSGLDQDEGEDQAEQHHDEDADDDRGDRGVALLGVEARLGFRAELGVKAHGWLIRVGGASVSRHGVCFPLQDERTIAPGSLRTSNSKGRIAGKWAAQRGRGWRSGVLELAPAWEGRSLLRGGGGAPGVLELAPAFEGRSLLRRGRVAWRWLVSAAHVRRAGPPRGGGKPPHSGVWLFLDW